MLILSVILVSILVFNGCSHELYREFSSENWQKAHSDERLEMAQDLIDRELLIGKTKEELLSILGEKGLLTETSNTIEYIVAYNALWEPISLCIEFDMSGYVVDTTIYWR